MKWILVGPPGSGKGTQSPVIKDEYCLCHLATGDMLRSAVAAKTPLGIKAKEAMDKVIFFLISFYTSSLNHVPAFSVAYLVGRLFVWLNLFCSCRENLSLMIWWLELSIRRWRNLHVKKDLFWMGSRGLWYKRKRFLPFPIYLWFFFFRFPHWFLMICLLGKKKLIQLDEMLEKQGTKIDKVLNFAIDDSILEERITGRWIHPASGRSYHTKFAPPKVHGFDDVSWHWSHLFLISCFTYKLMIEIGKRTNNILVWHIISFTICWLSGNLYYAWSKNVPSRLSLHILQTCDSLICSDLWQLGMKAINWFTLLTCSASISSGQSLICRWMEAVNLILYHGWWRCQYRPFEYTHENSEN